ncbi:RRM domain-containing protein [Aphis craccivora]|uniref:RRM domain-containing protein n=1 Tax=Aphis craccivora TaxID=307492 RepID=A0A6G0ZBR4_APHCR|nr:RRM domain-containing protein [Aphis craccivora]
MFALPSDYVIAQNAGKTFAADYYGRLSVSAESVTDLFTECSRYYSMDSLDGRPTVGRSGAIREVRRFLSTYSGFVSGFVKIVSVDEQTNGDEWAKKNFGSNDGRSDDDYVFH